MKEEKINYYLVLEKRLGDYNIIDINRLDIVTKEIPSDILSIDFFTCEFTEGEIRESIIRSNMARPEYLDGRLRIISDARHKHNLTVLTKEIHQNIMEFQISEEEIDQNFKNKFGAYKKIVESSFNDPDFIKRMLERFKSALKNGFKKDIFKLIEELPYSKSRNIYISIYKMLNKEQIIDETKEDKEKDFINHSTYRANYNNQNKRILEKLNDVA